MSISSTTRKTSTFTGNGVTTSFPFTFKVQASTDLVVLMLEDDVETTVSANDYTVSLNANQNSNPGGSVVFDTAPTSSQQLLITTDDTAVQEVSLQNQGSFNPTVINEAFDKVTILIQQLSQKVSRSLRLSLFNSNDGQLPAADNGKVLGWVGGVISNVTLASVGSISIAASWASLLVTDAGAALAALRGVTKVASYNDLANLTTATGLVDGGVYFAAGRGTVGGRGKAWFRWVAGDTTTPNGTTVIQLNAGGAGRFFMLTGDKINIECFDSALEASPTSVSYHTAWNAWKTALLAGASPNVLKFGPHGYKATTKPDVLEDINATAGAPSIEGCGLSRTTLLMDFSGADKTEALIHLKGNSGGGYLRDFAIGTAATGVRGGSLIRLEAKSGSAPDATAIENLYLTSYGVATAQAPTSATNANPAVFTLAAHGYSVDDIVVLLVTTRNSGWRDLNFQAWKINTVPSANTFTLKTLAGVVLDSTSWGTFPTGGITIKKALCADVNLSIDGTARTTGAVGVRNTKLNHLQIFGAASAAIEALGAVELSAPGVTTSNAGWNGQVFLGGVSGVETYYAQFDGGTIAALSEDRSVYTHGSVTVQGWHKRTTNTFYSDVKGWRGGDLVDTSTVANLNAGPNLIHHGGGIVTLFLDVSGLTGAAATKAFGITFNATPRIFAGLGSQTVLTNADTNSVDVANATTAADVLQITGQI